MSATYILYQTIRDADGEEVEASRWTNDTLLLTVQNGPEFRTACTEERELAIIGINRGSARRLARLLNFQWSAQ